jgi:branched-chain amino acid transport system ATP-binding protein
VLSIENLSAGYGPVQALSDVAIHVPAGGFVAVVGPNGAGKTTLFKTISGTVPARAGGITYLGQNLLAVPPPHRPRLGLAHVPEGRQVFRTLTVAENLEMGTYAASDRAAARQALDGIYTLFPRLAERRAQLAGTLSGGEQQMLAIGRGLASAPKLLMLDEPSMGLAPAIVDTIFETIQDIHKRLGLTVLLVEQRVAEALQSCSAAYVMETGRVVLSGEPADLMRDDRIKRAYLGM